MRVNNRNLKLSAKPFGLLKGQSLVEVVIGVGVAVMLSVALITTSLITQKTARTARNRTQATKLAQETIEQMRIYRDRKGYDTFAADAAGKTCIALVTPEVIDSWSMTSCIDPGYQITLGKTIFYRKTEITDSPVPASGKLVKVTISWDESGGRQTVVTQTIITKWDQS